MTWSYASPCHAEEFHELLTCRILAMEEKPPMQKQSFAYILGWSQEQIAGCQAACKHLAISVSVSVITCFWSNRQPVLTPPQLCNPVSVYSLTA